MPEAGQSAGDQPPRRPNARLQPEIDAADLFDYVDEVLGQFEACSETALRETIEETKEADRAKARLARLGGDTQLYERLAEQNFTGTEYKLFRAELAAYGLPVLRSFIRRKLIYRMCQDVHRPVSATEEVREHLARHVEDRLELAGETIARALRLFERYALHERNWSPERGASLKTFFIGACVRSFSAAFKRWAAEHDPVYNMAVRLDALEHPPEPRAADDPAEQVVGLARIKDRLDGMKPAARGPAARVVLFGDTFEEAGEPHDLSARAVEGHFYRLRKEARRREQKRGGA
uniref:hypothetical protein n=1 Tax=Amycolatopsis sp. CA-082387 TaxID=3239918 RepID=UPI003F499155